MAFYLRMFHGLTRFGRFILTNVIASITIIIIVTGVSVGLGLFAMFSVKPSPVIDLSIKAFGIPNHVVSQRQDAYDLAVSDYVRYVKTGRIQRRSVKSHSELTESDSFGMTMDDTRREKRSAGDAATQRKRWEVVYLVYLAKNGDNIFTLDRIRAADKIEKEIFQLPQFNDFCYVEQQQCAPLKSLIPFIYKESVTDSQEVLDGAVRQALSMPNGIYFTDGHVSETNHKSRFLRSEIYFGYPLAGKYISALLKFSIFVFKLNRNFVLNIFMWSVLKSVHKLVFLIRFLGDFVSAECVACC